jgi:hypothetical protein
LKIGLGTGLIICILVPIVLLLFGTLDIAQTASGILLLAGLWTIVYGVAFSGSRDRIYNVGFGVIVAVLSTFLFLAIQYVVGLILVAIIAMVLVSVSARKKP